MSATAAVGHTVLHWVIKNQAPRLAFEEEAGWGVGVLCSLTLLVKMKGHVGGGSGSRRLQGVGYSVKAKSFSQVLHVSIRNGFPSKYYFDGVRKNICAERLLEMSGSVRAFHLGRIAHKLESLIMAQNERWRHA